MRRVLIRAAAVVGLAAVLSAALSAADRAEKGKLRILRAGQVIGSERYEVVTTVKIGRAHV